MTGQTLSKLQIENLVIRQMNSTPRPGSVTRSEITGLRRPRPTSQYYSLPTSPRYTPLPLRPLSQTSFLNESFGSTRSSVSPRREVWGDETKHRTNKQADRQSNRHTGVFDTLYQPQLIRRNNYSPFRSAEFSRNQSESQIMFDSKPKLSEDLKNFDEFSSKSSTSPKLPVRRRIFDSPTKTKSRPHRHSSFITAEYSDPPLLQIIENFENEAKLLKSLKQIPSPALKGVLSESQGVSNIQQTQGVPNIQRSQGVSNVQRGVFVDRFKGVSYDLEQSSNYDRLKKNVPPFRSKPGGKGRQLSSEKYFDNLISLIEEASSSLEI